MKTTLAFKNTIQAYLDGRALIDPLFAQSYAKENKNIDTCITYILNTVQKSGCNGFTDDEVYSMAIHYYDEDTLDTGKPINCSVVVNHTVELTQEEKEQARKDAILNYQNNSIAEMKKKAETKKPKTETAIMLNLFD